MNRQISPSPDHALDLTLPDRELHFALLEQVCARQNLQFARLSKGYLAAITRKFGAADPASPHHSNAPETPAPPQLPQSLTRYVWGRDFGLNPASSAAILNDKYAIYEALTYHHIPAAECQIIYHEGDPNSWAVGCNSLAFAEQYFRAHQSHIVLKPNYGSQGIGVRQITSLPELAQAYREVFACSYSASLCPFYNIQHEYRVVILDGAVRLAYMKTTRGDWRFNLHHGALASPIPSADYPTIIRLARQAFRALDLRFCSVDIIKTTDNQLLVMELNNGVTLTGYLKQHPEELDRILSIYHDAVAAIFARPVADQAHR